jgi:hypothetical protein
MNEKEKCIFCESSLIKKGFQPLESWFCDCPICGRFSINDSYLETIDKDKYASYLCHNAIHWSNNFYEEDKYPFYLNAAYVAGGGEVFVGGYDVPDERGVRPALWLSLE